MPKIETPPDMNIEGNSLNWCNRMSRLSPTTCGYCAKSHGKIFPVQVLENKSKKAVNEHPNCRCEYVRMRTKKLGTVTNIGYNGADVFLYYMNQLPSYYIRKEEAESFGWENWKGNLDSVLPRKMIGGDVFEDDHRKLPSKEGRIWYEADINYTGGYRNNQRVLYSNDGLIFVSYDHYHTFYEITK